MKQLLLPRMSAYFYSGFLIMLLSIFSATNLKAQCPTTACIPGNAPSANLVFGMGILNVNVNNGAINNTTGTASQGYQNYSCTIGTTLTATVAYPISIQTNTNVNENVKVWIDFNNDGVFNTTTELVFSSVNAKLHTGTITIPATATMNTPLRMRVAADNFSSPIPTPCYTPQYSQAEDYRITVTPNTNAPVAEFSASNTITCSNTVSFTDLSQNGPTSWTWNFGDPASGVANTSTLQNPTHVFSAPGTYTITLTACNTIGCNTKTKTNYITYHTNIPVAATCTPGTANYCCGYGITNVNFGGGLMTNTSVDGAAGYQDFTCAKSVTAIAGNQYSIALTSGSNPQDTRIYIDLNNDGSFTGSNEMVLQLLNKVNPSGTITIPGTTFLNTPLRMRIISDEIGSAFTSCGGIQSGQAEDYTIKITPNPNPPVAQFTSSYAASCDTIVQFTDQSSNAPTSWSWNFGDAASGAANTSTLANPIHIYHNPGTYTISLTATNANGSNTMTKTNYVTVVKPCLTYCGSTGHNNNNLYISNVSLSNLTNPSTQALGGYSNFTAQTATLVQGNPATLSVTRAGAILNSSVSAWIDFNRNGIFETTERVMALNATNSVATGTISVPGTAPLGATRMRIATSNTTAAPTNPCAVNQFNYEVEDYTVIIQTNQQPPIVDFTVPSQVTCAGVVNFSDNSINVPTSWSWNFGDPASGAANTSTLQNPTHTYATTGFYTVTLTAGNGFGTSTITKSNYINYDPNNTFCTTVIMPVTGTAPTATRCTGTIYDSGGISGQYSNSENGIVTIAPSGAGSVTLTFSAFDAELNWDFLKIYDGPSITSPLIGSYTGTTLPTMPGGLPGVITSTSSALTLQFTSDNVATRDGFAATWQCTPITTAPAANLVADLSTICTGSVSFQDRSTNSPTSWTWNFGDGSPTSTLQNPTHTYNTATPGTYTVTLTSCNSFGCNTVTKTNYINITVPCLTYCASNGHNNSSQWISNVQLGTINNTTGPDANGYGNYTNVSTNLMLGTTTNPVSVTLGNNASAFGNVVIWIDYNKDGTFQTTEIAYSGQATSSSPGAAVIAAGNISIPSTALTGQTRMRVILSQVFNLTNPCILNQQRAETEDYTINILPNSLPTVANFTANLDNICTGVVQFSDASTNGATSWTWNFGDGSPTSSLQNPTHTYATGSPASYNVTLIACKGTQCSTVTKNNFVNITVPCLTYCTSNGHTNTNQWISNVTAGTLNNTTVAEVNGYGNYTYLNTSMMLGSTANPITVKLGSPTGFFEFIAIWIDYNKDGIFQATERAFNVQANNVGGIFMATGNIAIPGTALAGTTRMRVMMTPNNNQTNPCITGQVNTEVEDYAINILPNSLPTVANFTANLDNICTGVVQFSDASTNGATSWTWNFGDGSPTSSLQNPTHTYATGSPASYNVTLIACKGTQCSTVTKNNFVNITVPCLTYCTSNGHTNANQWIGNVTMSGINNTTVADPLGYGNYTYITGNAIAGASSNNVTVKLGNSSGPFEYVEIWVDLNRDGNFQPNERVYNFQAINTGPGIISSTGALAIPATASIGVTRMRVIMTPFNNLTTPCVNNQFNTEVEDYSINIQPNTVPPVINFSATPQTTCNGHVTFNDLSINGPTSWIWNFGDGTPNSTLQNPTHTYATPGNYTVTLTAGNAYGTNTVGFTNFVSYDPTHPTCFAVNMPLTGQVTSTLCSGTLYDNGGPTSNYSDNVNSTVVIAPANATRVSLMFTSLDLETCCDAISIYNGNSTSAPLLGTFSGSTLPQGGTPFIGTSGALTIRFVSDPNVNGAGFAATWSCNGLGVKEDLKNTTFEVYPNPTTGLVNLQLTENATEDYNLEIINLVGKVIMQKTVSFSDKKVQALDLSKLSKGVYFIRIQNSKTSGIRKVILD